MNVRLFVVYIFEMNLFFLFAKKTMRIMREWKKFTINKGGNKMDFRQHY